MRFVHTPRCMNILKKMTNRMVQGAWRIERSAGHKAQRAWRNANGWTLIRLILSQAALLRIASEV